MITLIGGEDAGKSTFASGLIKYITRSNKSTEDYYLVRAGDKSGFQKDVINKMEKEFMFPAKTKRGEFYAVEINVRSNTGLRNRKVEVLDIPGEVQEQFFRNIIESKYEFSEIKEIPYIIKAKQEREEEIEIEEWSKLFYYDVLASSDIISLMRADKEPEDTIYIELLDSNIVKRKRRKCFIITACDKIGYNPDKYKAPLIYPRFADNALEEKIRDEWGINGASLLNYAKSNKLDLLGSAVGADKDDPRKLRREGKSFVSKGFGGIKRWILK